jgi:hypothetical protein
MKRNLIVLIAACTALAASLAAQSVSRRAVISGGGGFDSGKCTIEVVVDGAAEVEIRGDTALLRNLKGQPPQWRRFECNGVLPLNPVGFRFSGVDGRGRQTLVGDPGRGGVAVVRIEDPDNGMEGYTFDIRWGGSGGPVPGRPPEVRGPGRRFTTEEAVRVCQDAARDQASGRFHTREVEFLRTTIDDQPGRNDWVIGTLAVRRFDRREIYRFSCSVNFDTGRVRSAQIELVAERDGGERRGGTERAIENCRRSVEDRLHNEGFDRIDFRSINVDDRPGRSDWIVGNVRAEGRGRTEFREFGCSVDLRDGDVRSVDVRRPR